MTDQEREQGYKEGVEFLRFKISDPEKLALFDKLSPEEQRKAVDAIIDIYLKYC